MAKNKLSEGLKSWYRQLWTNYLIRNPKTPYNVSIPGHLTLICHSNIVDDPFLKFGVLRLWKYRKMAKIKLSETLKSRYRQLWADYLIRNPKTPYNVSLPGYLILICHLRSCRWPISQILGIPERHVNISEYHNCIPEHHIVISEHHISI